VHKSQNDPDAVVYATPSLDLDDLIAWFFPVKKCRLIGLEIECGLVRPKSGSSVGYDEPSGGRALLKQLLETIGGEPIVEGAALVGLIFEDKSTLTLEMSGAIEYSSPPEQTLTECLALAKRRLVDVARVAARMGIRLLSGGYLPFDTAQSITWVPKPRTEIMRRYFNGLGKRGRFGDQVMGLTLSTQVSLDALSPAEYLDKVRTLTALSPFVAALLVNTPSLVASADREMSVRMNYWRQIDPARCQNLSGRMFAAKNMQELISEFASVSMIYRQNGHSFLPAPDYSFRNILRRGFCDGSFPAMSDWETHLSQLWPSVRARRTLETRLPDGQSWEHLEVLPALFVGLVEEAPVRHRVGELVRELSADELDLITTHAARGGFGGLPASVQEMGLEILRLAYVGLENRVANGLEAPALLGAMEPILEIATSGRTFADDVLEKWNGKWGRSESKYVEAMSVPFD
jgi:glutamate--cysteine ligase